MDYPEKLIRRISDPNFVKSGYPSAEIFKFYNMSREDGFFESSINWYDDEKALDLIMEQRKENDKSIYQFRFGAAIIDRHDADRIMKNPTYKDVFRYERAPIEGRESISWKSPA
jgi:hypothetical protein